MCTNVKKPDKKFKIYSLWNDYVFDDRIVPEFGDYYKSIVVETVEDIPPGSTVILNITFEVDPHKMLALVERIKKRSCFPILNRLCEPRVYSSSITDDHCKILESNKWFWINEARTYARQQSNLDSKKNKIAFMPMRLSRNHRNILLQTVSEFLPDMIWSYNVLGHYLPDDKFFKPLDSYNKKDVVSLDRHVNIDWYNHTFCSVVAETIVGNEMFVTEKTWKPIIHGHPFMVLGPDRILEFLQDHGFYVFENLFDISYDKEKNITKKCQIIKSNLEKIKHLEYYDTYTKEKIQDNRNIFFHESKIHQFVLDEIIYPIYQTYNASGSLSE